MITSFRKNGAFIVAIENPDDKERELIGIIRRFENSRVLPAATKSEQKEYRQIELKDLAGAEEWRFVSECDVPFEK